jgi:dihydrofolate reductase
MEVSVDGFVAKPGGDLDWIFASFDDESTAYDVELLWEAGVHIMGGVTYRDMAAHWPTSHEPFAPPMNDIPKVVFSRTLQEADWPESSIARGDLAEEVAQLKEQPGKDILAHGGAGFAQALSRLGLVDEYRLHVHPVALGHGLPLFAEPVDLKLEGVRPFPGGMVALTYTSA